MIANALGRAFYRRDTVRVARALLGQLLVSTIGGQRTAGLIVETEAYLGVNDQAAHTKGGRRTPRVESMWQDPGTAYVFLTYGMHHLLNISTRAAGIPEAILIRALQPVDGIDTMRSRRGLATGPPRHLTNGPGKLCQGLAITRDHDGLDLTADPQLHLLQQRTRALPARRIAVGPRIGVDYAGAEWAPAPLRFGIAGHPCLSKPFVR